MKNIKWSFSLMLSITLIVLLGGLFGCNDRDNNPTPKTTDTTANNNSNGTDTTYKGPKGTLLFHLHNFIGEEEVDAYNIVYSDENGRKFLLTKAQLYISSIELVKLDGSIYKVPGTIILKTQETNVLEVGEVPVGNYKSVRFNIGLNSETNKKEPGSSDILNKSSMWFGSSAQPDGYIYFNVEGKVDTTSDASGTIGDMQPFSIKIGTDANYRQVVMPDLNYSISPNTSQFVHMYADLSKLFSGISLNNKENLTMNTPAANATSVGLKLGSNSTRIFHYEE